MPGILEERRNIMTNNQMNNKLENITEVYNTEVFDFKDIVNPKIQNKITEAYCNFYEQYLSQSNALEAIFNGKPNLKTWLFKAGTNKIFVMDSDSIEDFVESISTTKKSLGLVFLNKKLMATKFSKIQMS